MKAIVKATGEIVEVHTHDDADFQDRQGRFYWEHQLYFGSLDVRYDAPDYWIRLEHQYAGMAMQGMIRTVGHDRMYPPEKIAIYAEACAHTLVEKLKEKEEKK
jgi:hypothetical protein